MANDPLALPGIGAGPPQEAEYDTVYATVTATERGRWFLTEFASRNRHADTDLLVAALARIEATIGTAARSNEFARAPDIAAAAEKIQDIAFGLRERGADPALCDALDTAVREICDASKDGAESQERGAAPPEADQATPSTEAPPVAVHRRNDVSEDEKDNSRRDDFEFELQDEEKFAEAAAALAATLSSLCDQTEAAEEPQSTSSAGERQNSAAIIPPHDYADSAEPEPRAKPVESAPRWYIEPPDFAFHPPAPRTNSGVATSSEAGEPHPLRPGPRLLPNPEDDPAELFEPTPKPTVVPHPAASRVAEPAPASPASASTETASMMQVAESPPPLSRPAPPVRTVPQPVPISPLAALRALSEEELLALFG